MNSWKSDAFVGDIGEFLKIKSLSYRAATCTTLGPWHSSAPWTRYHGVPPVWAFRLAHTNQRGPHNLTRRIKGESKTGRNFACNTRSRTKVKIEVPTHHRGVRQNSHLSSSLSVPTTLSTSSPRPPPSQTTTRPVPKETSSSWRLIQRSSSTWPGLLPPPPQASTQISPP